MASIAVPFSGLPNHRFEVSANVIDVTATDYFVRIRSTIRRTSGTGTGVQGNGEHSYGINGPGGGAGGESPVPYNLTTAIAQEFPDQLWQLPASLWSPGDVATLNSSYVASTGPLGSADSGPLTVTLPPLSQVTYPGLPISVEAGAVLNIDLPRKSADYTHDLFYSIGTEQNVSIQTGAGASATWAVPMSLLQQIPNAPTGTLTITAITRDSEGRSLGQASSTTIMTVPASAKPTITGYELSDVGVPMNYPPVEAWVQTLSILKVDSITATAAYGATIVQTRVLIEGASLPVGATRTLLNAGTIPYTVRVWDSRGSFSDINASALVLDYFLPILQQYDVFRADSAGNPLEDGEYLVADIQALRSELFFPATPTTDRNTFGFIIQTREFGTTTWTERNVIDYPSPPLFDQAVLISGGGIYLNTKSYEVRLSVRDVSALSTSSQGPADRIVATGLVSIDVNGTNVGIGKTWANGKLDVDGDTYTERIRITGTGDVSPTSTDHPFQIGPTDGINLIIDGNEIMSRNNGVGQPTYFEAGISIGANGYIIEPMPDPWYARGASANSLTGGAGSWQAISGATVTINPGGRPLAVDMTCGAVCKASTGYTMIGVNVTGGITVAPTESGDGTEVGAWWTPFTSSAVDTYITSQTKRIILPANVNTTFAFWARRSAGSGTQTCNYPQITIVPMGRR